MDTERAIPIFTRRYDAPRPLVRELPTVKVVGIRDNHFESRSFIDEEFVFTYFCEGESEYRFESSLYRIKPSSLCLMPPYLFHGVRPLGRVVKIVAHFELFNEPDSITGLPLVVQPPPEIGQLVRVRMLQMLKLWADKPPECETIVGGMMAELLGYYLQNVGTRVVPRDHRNPVWDKLERAMVYMRGNYQRNIGVGDLSQAAGLSTAYFSREFTRSVGITPYAYLNQVRVEKAKRLLLRGAANCSEVASLCGFSSLHVFSKAFKRVTRRSPTDWVRREVV